MIDRPCSLARDPDEIPRDTAGQATAEWLLVTAVIVLPIILCIPVMLDMLNSYFNRITGIVTLPFP